MSPKHHRCLSCCGPKDERSRDAISVQAESTRAELVRARVETEHLRHFVRGDARLAMHLFVIWRADAWRHRHRADAFAAQLRAAGLSPVEPKIPPLPPPRDDDDRDVARWFARATTEEDAA